MIGPAALVRKAYDEGYEVGSKVCNEAGNVYLLERFDTAVHVYFRDLEEDLPIFTFDPGEAWTFKTCAAATKALWNLPTMYGAWRVLCLRIQ